MIVKRLKKLSQYNVWAWDYVIDSMYKISKEEFKKERPFFWGSLHGLLAHSLAAEIIWIERLNHKFHLPREPFFFFFFIRSFPKWKKSGL